MSDILGPPTEGVGTPPEPERAAENSSPTPFREMTVGDLIERLRDMPEHRPVTIIVNETAGVITDVWEQKLNPQAGEAPHVLIGERQKAGPIVPPSWLPTSPAPARKECTWPRCRRSPNPCFAWCKCPCHVRTPPGTPRPSDGA